MIRLCGDDKDKIRDMMSGPLIDAQKYGVFVFYTLFCGVDVSLDCLVCSVLKYKGRLFSPTSCGKEYDCFSLSVYDTQHIYTH